MMKLTRAFCLGVERQHITEAQLIASSKNVFSKFFLSENSKDLPSIIKPNAIKLLLAELELSLAD